MTNHGRRYGEKTSRPIPVWNGIFEHRARIDGALWAFLWLLDKITKERDGVGIVWDGRPIRAMRIAADLGCSEKTVRLHLDRLEANGYIRRKLAPYGFVIQVLNSWKFGIRKSHKRSEKNVRPVAAEVGKELPTSRKDSSDLLAENVRPRRDAALNAAPNAAMPLPVAKSPLWEELGVRPESLPPPLRELFEGLYSTKGSQPTGVVLGLGLDMWTDQGNKIPPQLARAAAEFRGREKQEKDAACARPELEELPWAKR